MPLSQRALSYLAFAMFALMWLAAIAQSPGGMGALGRELAGVEQALSPSRPPRQSGGAGGESHFETFPGGILCQVDAGPAGTEHTTCRAPGLLYPY